MKKRGPLRVLFVAPANSVHTARWLAQLTGQGWDLHLFSSFDVGGPHPAMPSEVKVHGASGGSSLPARALRKARRALFPGARLAGLCRLISKLEPDIVHSLEMQHGAYLTLDAKRRLGPGFPVWILTNWGSDIQHFGRFAAHAARIREALAGCDYYQCECERDVRLAREFGYKGPVLPVIPNFGGFDLEQVRRLRGPLPPSKRRRIMLKGYQGWAGRALAGLAALEKCAGALAGYEVCVYVSEVSAQARAFSRRTGIKTTFVPGGTPHEEILRLHGSSRVSIGLSISDSLSASFLEAAVMGSFPVQSDTGAAAEWLADGKTCLLVPPEDPVAVAAALRRALTDDALVDAAAEANIALLEEKLAAGRIAPVAREMYARVAKESNLLN
ncbi:MAG TPA: glycosyltransferase [Elusimicrobiota bacterium]|jgi:glycosyltransferase involved in cell wall biosynthesis|nr:glycosyltransferase [Elusimicrobiota bacterium]